MKKILLTLFLAILSVSIITCGANKYSISVTVSGLDGTLVLRINDAYDVTTTENATVVFDVKLEESTDYAVTVYSKPSNQNCTVANGTGTIGKEDVTDVTVTCTNKTWTHPSSISDNISPDGQDAAYSFVAMDDSGNAIITWVQNDSTYDRLYKSEYRNGSWTHPADLTDSISFAVGDVEADFRFPNVAMDNLGNAIIVWVQQDGAGSERLYKSEYRNGSWTHPSDQNDSINVSDTPVSVYVPYVAMDDNGNAIIIWSQEDGSEYQIYKAEYRNAAWTYPSDLNSFISFAGLEIDETYPFVAMGNNGEALIVWGNESNDASYAHPFISEYRNGAWTNPSDSGDYIGLTGTHGRSPHTSINASGDSIVSWFQFANTSDDEIAVLASEYRNGSWTHPTDLNSQLSLSGYYASSWGSPFSAVDNNGNSIITWQCENGGGGHFAFFAEYRNGSWTKPAAETDALNIDSFEVYFPMVAMDNNGNAIITTVQGDSGPRVFKSEYRKGSWTHPTQDSDKISPDGGLINEWTPMPAMGDNGDAIIVWSQDDGSGNSQIFKSEYR